MVVELTLADLLEAAGGVEGERRLVGRVAVDLEGQQRRRTRHPGLDLVVDPAGESAPPEVLVDDDPVEVAEGVVALGEPAKLPES